MPIAVLMIISGIGLMVLNPGWGLVPAFLLLAFGVMIGVVAVLGQRPAPYPDIAATKACPECRARIPLTAVVCHRCGYQFANDAA